VQTWYFVLKLAPALCCSQLCTVGECVHATLIALHQQGVRSRVEARLRPQHSSPTSCTAFAPVCSYGSAVWLDLEGYQKMTGRPNRISVVQPSLSSNSLNCKTRTPTVLPPPPVPAWPADPLCKRDSSGKIRSVDSNTGTVSCPLEHSGHAHQAGQPRRERQG
jgi:hypothetical protein